MSEKNAGNRLNGDFCAKNQRNQSISYWMSRELPCHGRNGSESTMQLARFFRD